MNDTLILLWAVPMMTYVDLSGELTRAGLVQDGKLTASGRRKAAELVLADPETTPEAKARARVELSNPARSNSS